MKYCGNSGSLELDGSLRLFYDAVTIVNIDAARHLSSSTSIASTQPGVTNALPSQNRHEIPSHQNVGQNTNELGIILMTSIVPFQGCP